MLNPKSNVACCSKLTSRPERDGALEPSPSRALYGFGLRAQHYAQVLRDGVRCDWLEVVTENFMRRGGRPLAALARVRKDVALALHGVSLSIGSLDPLCERYLSDLEELVRRFDPLVVSDHLCFASFGGHYAHDLWPLPYTEEALEHVARRVHCVQERIGRQLLLENVSSYVEYQASTLHEWEFMAELARRTGAGILLDLNNVFVSATNHGYSATDYIDALPAGSIQQLHLAGHKRCRGYLLDDHGSRVPEPVWQLYRYFLTCHAGVPAIVEWDDNVPELAVLEAEAETVRRIATETLPVARAQVGA
jgi:uncharacterized protein